MRQANRKGGQRIVSLAPSATSILVALGAGRDLVGVTKWCAEVVPAGKLPSGKHGWEIVGRSTRNAW